MLLLWELLPLSTAPNPAPARSPCARLPSFPHLPCQSSRQDPNICTRSASYSCHEGMQRMETSGGRMERVHGAWKTRKMMWNRCWGSSRASGRAGRGLRACAHMCATALRPLPWHCQEEKALSDTCHPARELPRCREPCQALIQERGLLVLPRGHTFLGATRAAAGEGAQLVDEQMPCAPAPGKLQEDSSPRSNPSC